MHEKTSRKSIQLRLLRSRMMILELLSVIIPSILLRLTVASSSSSSASCAPAVCGNLSISYPFSLDGVQPLECGFPVFNLTCNAGRAYISRTFREHLYHVQKIFYENSSLVVAVETSFAGDETCRIPDFNIYSSLAPFPLTVSKQNKDLTFVYNCEGPLPPSVELPQKCANRSVGAYFSEDTEAAAWKNVSSSNCSHVSLPVRTFHERPQAREYAKMISDGFLLEWPASEDCNTCRLRGGECSIVQLAFQCICSDRQPCPTHTSASRDKTKKQKIKIILIVSIAAATSLILSSIVWKMYYRKENKILFIKKYTSNESNIEEILKGHDSLTLKRYKYSELRKITRSFKEKLGEGGYGMVFKGNLEDGQPVAVKILKGSEGNGEDFLNEVVSIRKTSHVNIVNLLGFCLHGSKRALIYEYMANGSLDKYIYLEESKMAIGWEKLQHIAVGIARGLEYLHRGCNTRIIHFDIKPHNVLLDENFCPKIADFGLAKLCHLKDSALSIAEARGTIGFIAPEVFFRGFGVVSTKSDVYSYGMMLLDMVGGRKDVKENTDTSEAYFPNWIYDRLVNDLQSHVVSWESEEIARQMTLVGLWCIQTSPTNRPSMSRVIEMLENSISELEIPPKPFLSCPSPSQCFSY